jgi:hypothetical protein
MTPPIKERLLRYLEARGIRVNQNGTVESVRLFEAVEPYQRCC